MRRSFVVSLASLFFLSGCNNPKKPSNANFTEAIDQYLAKRDDACSSLGQTLPIDVTVSEQKEQYGIGPQLATLEEAGLVHSTNTTAVVHTMLDALQGSRPPQPVRRYELTDQGKKYYRNIPATFGQNGIFCYGQETVDSIIKWTEPATTEGGHTKRGHLHL